jgi:hypothetical protein
MAQGYVLQDDSFYFATQSGFGVPATTFKGALGITSYEVTPAKTTIEGVPFLGSGIWRGQDIPTGATVNWRVEAWGSLTQIMALVATLCSGVKGTTTTLATTGFSTPYTMNGKNSSKKYSTLAFVESEGGTPGAGLKRITVRDAIAGNVVVTAQSGQVFSIVATGTAISMGPGAVSTFSFNNNLHVPNLSNPANVITYPSFFPAGFCSTQFNMTYNVDLAYGPNCIGSPIASDILIDNARWTVEGSGIADTNFSSFHDSVWYGTASPAADTSQLTAKLQSGALDIVIVSDDIIASSSPTTPFSTEFNFPTMQFTDAKFTGDRPRMGTWQAKSYGSATVITVNNDLSSASMVI